MKRLSLQVQCCFAVSEPVERTLEDDAELCEKLSRTLTPSVELSSHRWGRERRAQR